jgi:hypothetical protein
VGGGDAALRRHGDRLRRPRRPFSLRDPERGLARQGPREVALIAQIVRYYRKGTPGLDVCRRLARGGDGDLVARCVSWAMNPSAGVFGRRLDLKSRS